MIERYDVAIIGAGFGGLALAHRLAQSGITDVVLLERSDGVGGTWRTNHYPGAACDVPSHLYSLSFAPNSQWSRAYADQPEILAYIEDCYDRFDLRDKVRLRCEVVGATWSESELRWHVRTGAGDEIEARFLVSAMGLFHTPSFPTIRGLADFSGPVHHSALWDDSLSLANMRVAVIGTGASAIQVVPAIAEQTRHLDLYQRSAPWILPRRNEPYSVEQRQFFEENPEEAAEHRQGLHDLLEQTTAFLTGDPSREMLAATSAEYLARSVKDPGLRAALTPTHPFGCTRPLVSSEYYRALLRDNVELVTSNIDQISAAGIQTVDGTERLADAIVLCTGFRTAAYLGGIDVVGRGGVEIHDRWGDLPRAYHGLVVPGFPNLFMMYGPNTNQGGNSIILILEAQAQFVASALESLEDVDGATIEVTETALKRYVEELEGDLAHTVWVDGCRSYFHTASGDVVTQLPHTSGWYRTATQSIDLDDFVIDGSPCPTS